MLMETTMTYYRQAKNDRYFLILQATNDPVGQLTLVTKVVAKVVTIPGRVMKAYYATIHPSLGTAVQIGDAIEVTTTDIDQIMSLLAQHAQAQA